MKFFRAFRHYVYWIDPLLSTQNIYWLFNLQHRVSSVRDYDSVVVLDEGRVAERGRADALLAAPASLLARLLAAGASQRHT